MQKIKSFSVLPNDYQAAAHINLKSTKLIVSLNLWSLVLLVPFLLGIYIYFQINPILNPVMFFGFDLLMYLGLVLLLLVIHELIHGIFFKLGTDEKVTYKFHGWAISASVKGIYFYKNHYLITGLAPFIIISALLIISMFIFPMHAFMLYIILAIHTAGCIGDFYVVLKLLKYNKDTLIHDYGIGMLFYTK